MRLVWKIFRVIFLWNFNTNYLFTCVNLFTDWDECAVDHSLLCSTLVKLLFDVSPDLRRTLKVYVHKATCGSQNICEHGQVSRDKAGWSLVGTDRKLAERNQSSHQGSGKVEGTKTTLYRHHRTPLCTWMCLKNAHLMAIAIYYSILIGCRVKVSMLTFKHQRAPAPPWAPRYAPPWYQSAQENQQSVWITSNITILKLSKHRKSCTEKTMPQ